MVPYYGDYAANATVYIPINTFDSNDPAASVTVTNLVNTDVHIHKDGGTTQRNNAAGITMTVDFDSITGNHLLIIDTSDNTVADFWEAGHEYQVRIEGATVDGGTINAWVGSFSIERAGGALALIKSATYGLSALKTLLDTTGIKVASFADNAITANAINNDAITAAKIANGAIDAATFAADVDAEIATMVWNAATASYGGAGTYGQAVEDTLADTNELQTNQGNWLTATGFSTHSAADVADAVWDEVLHTAHEEAGSASVLLQGATAPSAADVADAVWNETLADHLGAGSTGNALNAAGSAGDPWATALPGSYGAGTAGLLLGTTIPAAIDAIDNYVDTEIGALTTELAKVPKSDSNVTWNNTALGSIQTKCGDALAAYDPPTNAEMEARTIASANYATASNLSTTDGKIDSIKTKTDSLTFTKSGEVDSNIKSINGTTVTGDGGVTPWGP